MTGSQEKQFLKAFGKNLAGTRRAKSLTQQRLAAKVNMSVVSIAYLETGKRWCRIGTLHKIAKVLKVDISELFRGLK